MTTSLPPPVSDSSRAIESQNSATLARNANSTPQDSPSSPPGDCPQMTRFHSVQVDASTAMVHRSFFLAQPCEFFKTFFHGRTPTVSEKILFIEQAVQRMTSLRIYENDLYRVEVVAELPFIHLDIRRRDGGTCKEWKHFQQIKNELVGPEYEAVELFPAESRLVDAGNQYHLWVHTDPHYRFNLGFQERFVLRDLIPCDSVGRRVPAVEGGESQQQAA